MLTSAGASCRIRMPILNYSKYSLLFTHSRDWTYHLQMISLSNLTLCVLMDDSVKILGTLNLMLSSNPWDTTYYFYVILNYFSYIFSYIYITDYFFHNQTICFSFFIKCLNWHIIIRQHQIPLEIVLGNHFPRTFRLSCLCCAVKTVQCNHHHHHVEPRISLTLSLHFSLSFIASDWSSGLHPLSSHRCCMYILAGRPALARPYVGVHRSTSLMGSM